MYRSLKKRQSRVRGSLESLEARHMLSTVFLGVDGGDESGSAVAPAGNIFDSPAASLQGDDFLIASALADPNGREDAGEVYVVFGDNGLPEIGCINPTVTQDCKRISSQLTPPLGGFPQAIRIIGAREGDQLGTSIVVVGDIIGDSRADILIGAPFAESDAELQSANRGRAYLIGGDFVANIIDAAINRAIGGNLIGLSDVTLDLADLDPNDPIQLGSWQIYQGNPGDEAGTAVSGVGQNFITIGAPNADRVGESNSDDRGAAYVLGSEERETSPGTFRPSGIQSLSDLVTANRGSIVLGPSKGAHFGAAVSGAALPALGPADGAFNIFDGAAPDLIVGAPDACAENDCDPDDLTDDIRPGRVYVLSGTNLTRGSVNDIYDTSVNDDLRELAAIPVQGIADGDMLGARVTSAGDLDGDRNPQISGQVFSDIMFSAPGRDAEARIDAGEIYVVFGREVNGAFFNHRIDPADNTSVVVLEVADFTQGSPIGLTLRGEAAGDMAGLGIAPAGNYRDLAGQDAIPDIIVGSPGYDVELTTGVTANGGRAYVLLGSRNYRISGRAINLGLIEASGTGTLGNFFNGRNQDDFYGSAVAGVGNVLDPTGTDGDEILIGAPGADGMTIAGATVMNFGESELFFGPGSNNAFPVGGTPNIPIGGNACLNISGLIVPCPGAPIIHPLPMAGQLLIGGAHNTNIILGPQPGMIGGPLVVSAPISFNVIPITTAPNPHFNMAGGVLTITASDSNDSIRAVNRGRKKITFVNDFSPNFSINPKRIKTIVIHALAGDDVINLSRLGNYRTMIHGGDGDDRIIGGRGQNIILGNGGDDHLVGGRRDDIIIGGDGADRIVGQAGSDLLFGGELDPDSNVNINRVRNRWRKMPTAAGKIRAAQELVDAILDDGDADKLRGGSGFDLYQAAVNDSVIGKQRNEFVADFT